MPGGGYGQQKCGASVNESLRGGSYTNKMPSNQSRSCLLPWLTSDNGISIIITTKQVDLSLLAVQFLVWRVPHAHGGGRMMMEGINYVIIRYRT